MKPNVRGRGKEKLDPEKNDVRTYVRKKNSKDEWEKCIQTVDVKNRGTKRTKNSEEA